VATGVWEVGLRSRRSELAAPPAVVLSCFDRTTRLLPFVFYDSRIFPAGARVIAGALYQAGFLRTRAVFQLWNPAFRPSCAQLDGRSIQMLLVSSMEMHAGQAYKAIRDAHRLGADRPLISAARHKPFFHPSHYGNPPVIKTPPPPDVPVPEEAFFLLAPLTALLHPRGGGERRRAALDRARRERALESVPGLV